MTPAHEERLTALLDHGAALARRILRSPSPAGNEASSYLREKKRLHPTERRLVSSLAFSTLRKLFLLRTLAGDGEDVTTLQCGFALMLDSESMPGEVPGRLRDVFASRSLALPDDAGLRALPEEWIDMRIGAGSAMAAVGTVREMDAELAARTGDNGDEDGFIAVLSVRSSIPEWLLRALHTNPAVKGRAGLHALALALQQPAPADIRLNARAGSPTSMRTALLEGGIASEPFPLSPRTLRLLDRGRVTDSAPYLRGEIEVQDAGSQLLGAAGLNPGARTIHDACAGAGGKTLQLADLHPEARIVASDIEAAKLRSLWQRALRAGVSDRISVMKIRPGHDPFTGKEALLPGEGFDTVFVDAPCAGTGTLRRNPGLRYRLAERTVEKLADRQLDLLTQYASHCRAGGVLVYSTCSILARENQDVVQRFLHAHQEFVPDPLAPVFAAQDIAVTMETASTYHRTFTPSEDGTDGFFVARMRRS